MCRTPTAEAPQSDKQCYLQFLRSPVAIVADERGERVAGVKLELNELKVGPILHYRMALLYCCTVYVLSKHACAYVMDRLKMLCMRMHIHC